MSNLQRKDISAIKKQDIPGFIWNCSCGKEIKSLSYEQIFQWISMHRTTCDMEPIQEENKQVKENVS